MIEKRSPGSWRVGVQIETPEGWKWVRETIHVDPKLSQAKQRKEAELALARLKTSITDGEKGPAPQRYTVRSWSDVWLETVIKPKASPVTYAGYRHLLDRRILPLLGDVRLDQLTPVMLTEWLAAVRASPRLSTRKDDNALAHKRSPAEEDALVNAEKQNKPLSQKTIKNYYIVLNAMLSAAERLQIIKENPMRHVEAPRVRRTHVKSLTEKQAVELLRCLSDEPDISFRAAVLLALLCGLRLGEVGALKLSDIDWAAGTIDISRAHKYTPMAGSFDGDTKTEASERVITLPAGMIAILRADAEQQAEMQRIAPDVWQGEGWIVHGWDGRQLHHDTASKHFRKFADAHGFGGVRFHDLRHTHASLLLANNVDVVAVAARMGHSDASTTLRVYAHAMARRDQDAADQLDRILSDSQV